MSKSAKKIDRYVWKTDDGTEYRLADLPTDPCHKCDSEIGEDQYCYFRDRPGESLDHICWDCGNKITGFGDA